MARRQQKELQYVSLTDLKCKDVGGLKSTKSQVCGILGAKPNAAFKSFIYIASPL